MGRRTRSDISTAEGLTCVDLASVIDEDNDLGTITTTGGSNSLVVFAGEVERINSCGVRDWVFWLNELKQGGITVFLCDCSPALMTQVNMVNNFVGHAHLLSFYAPYFCSAGCEAEKMLLIDVRDALQDGNFHAPACRCDECDQLMEFDDVEDSYFSFLARLTVPQLPPGLPRLIEQRRSKAGDRLLRPRSGFSQVIQPDGTPDSSQGGVVRPSTRPGTVTSMAGEKRSSGPPEALAPAPHAPLISTGVPAGLLYGIVVLLLVAISLLGYTLLRNM